MIACVVCCDNPLTSRPLQEGEHPQAMLRVQDLEGDHRVSHDVLGHLKVAVLSGGTAECQMW